MTTPTSKLFDDALVIAQAEGFSVGDAHVVRIFENGLSHDTALFESTHKTFVLKIFRGQDQLSRQAIQAQKIASRHRLSPKVLYSNMGQGILICEYIVTPALGQLPTGDQTNQQLLRIADSLSALHNLEISNDIAALGNFDIVSFCAGYVVTADDRTKRQHELLLPTLSQFQNSAKKVFCHNDLVADNIFLLDNGMANFIDWEYAQLNDPWFDLAAIVFYLNLSEGSAKAFLARYLANCSESNNTVSNIESATASSKLIQATTVLLWGDILWHLHNYGNDYRPKLAHKLDWLKKNASAFK